jgi:hypothetical protein
MSAIYKKQPQIQTRWASFENPAGARGQGGRENQAAKGHAFDMVEAGQTKVLLDVQGCGIIHRLWLTLQQRQPEELRALRLDMFWDGAASPAVAVPLGDFFCAGLGLVPFQNELFASPEGRSFVALVPMPFRTGAKITLTNEGRQAIPALFYDINYSLTGPHPDDALYFHAYWRRENPTTLGQDFHVLPPVKGCGRFLGASFSVITNPVYAGNWWGEGEAKLYLDGDKAFPTLVGTGTEDYIGTGWGQGAFAQRFQGSLIADKEKGWWSFYRLHLPDPIYFQQDCRVTIQQIGGAPKKDIPQLVANGAVLKAISSDAGGYKHFIKLLDAGLEVTDPAVAETAWCNYYRQDDWAAVAYFYLDTPENGLPPLAPVAERVVDLVEAERMSALPAEALQAFYVPESLRAKEDGFAFNLQNPMTNSTILACQSVTVDGVTLDPSCLTVITLNGDIRPARAITAESPLPFPAGATLRIQAAGQALVPGSHTLVVRLLLQEIPGLLEIAVTDHLTIDA